MITKRLRQKYERRIARKRRVRMTVSGTAACPRISVYRSLRAVSAQAIDDVNGRTLATAATGSTGKKAGNTIAGAEAAGAALGAKLVKLGVATAVYDRNGYRYHGKVKALADGVRSAGVKM